MYSYNVLYCLYNFYNFTPFSIDKNTSSFDLQLDLKSEVLAKYSMPSTIITDLSDELNESLEPLIVVIIDDFEVVDVDEDEFEGIESFEICRIRLVKQEPGDLLAFAL